MTPNNSTHGLEGLTVSPSTDGHFRDVNILRGDGLAVGYAVVNGNITEAEALATAHLFAAAPDLYDALLVTQKLVSEGAMSGFADHEWAERLFTNQAVIAAALARARGEQA